MARNGSDHRPLLMKNLNVNLRKLTKWSREVISDINEAVNNWEVKLQYFDDSDIEDNTKKSREEINRAHAEYIRWLSIQDSLLKQKSRIKWFEDGGKNSRYFHCTLREKKRKQQLNRIKNHKEKWIMGDKKISKAAVKHFNAQFNLPPPHLNPSILEYIPKCITDQDNEFLCRMPYDEEIKNVVLTLSADSTAGPDGYNGAFLHNCWDIIRKEDNWTLKGHLAGLVNTTRKSYNTQVPINRIRALQVGYQLSGRCWYAPFPPELLLGSV
uniref:Uncharacterized protein LOC104229689 n=1 Tax=Nicotiana sylvestris TaxID=4096 RepID=A0A1U7WQ18_NICSY|nr:PREDICTED: uncharacterized protein LOC104229689 [Nicotiana sylvestris]